MIVLPNGSFVFVSTYGNSPLIDSSDVLFLRVDSAGNILSSKKFGAINKAEGEPKIAQSFDDKFILTYNTDRPKYLLIDSVGNYSWNYSPPLNSGIGAANDILVTRDSAWVFATSKLIGYIAPGVGKYIGYVFKFKNGEGVKWGTELRTEEHSPAIKMSRLVELKNGNIVAAGVGYNYNPNAATIWVNLLDGETGDSIWSKDYFPVGGDVFTSYVKEHTVYDMELTPSGYLVLCGETVSASYAPQPTQQGWLLKIGIPTDTTQLQLAQQAIGSDGFYMRLYPNPAQDYTIIDFSTALGKQENYRIFISNAQGQVLRDIPVQSANSGYIVDVAGLAAGVYYVSVLRGGQVLRTEKLVKM